MKKPSGYCFVTIFALFLISCLAMETPLTKEEKLLEERLINKYGGEIQMTHDDVAIKNGHKDGTFEIHFTTHKKGFCEEDSNTLIQISGYASEQLLPILSHKDDYQYITTYFRTTIPTGPSSERDTCTKRITRLIKNLDSVQFIIE